MIKSKRFMGLIKRGTTKLNLTIRIEQTAPMQLTVRKGDYIDVQGNKFTLANDVVLDFTADFNYEKGITISLVKNKTTKKVDVWVDEVVQDELHLPANVPTDYEVLLVLVGAGWFIIPPNTANLTDIDIYCMKVIE